MTDKKSTVVLQPEYVKAFTCDGYTCEDSCCMGTWTIHVDEAHYKKMKKVKDKALKDKIEKYLRRNKSSTSKDDYARLYQDKELGHCIFLTKNRLCELQMKFGADYLCNVCSSYPRFVRLIDDKYERSINMSCPLAAEKALLNPEPMAFEQIGEPQAAKLIMNEVPFNTASHHAADKLKGYFWDIRIFSLSLLQNRNYSLDERLIILGIVYKKIEALNNENRLHDLPVMLETMSNTIQSGNLKEELNKIPVNSQIQMRLAKEMTDQKVQRGIDSERYLECLNETLTGIGYEEGEAMATTLEKYEANYAEYLKPYLAEKEYIIENYLVNEYFKGAMPLGSYKSIWDSYIFLCVLYSIVKLHLIGMSGYHKGLNDELTLKLIQSLSKIVLHNNQYIQHIIKLLKDNGYDSLAYMSILVKS